MIKNNALNNLWYFKSLQNLLCKPKGRFNSQKPSNPREKRKKNGNYTKQRSVQKDFDSSRFLKASQKNIVKPNNT